MRSAAPAEPTKRALPVLRAVHIYEDLLAAAQQEAASGKPDEAMRMISDVLELLAALPDHRPYARVYIALGESLLDLNRPARAEPPLEQALGLASALPDARLEARAALALARAWSLTGNAGARAMFERARAAFVTAGDATGEAEATRGAGDLPD